MEGAEDNTERLLLAPSVEVRLLDKSTGLDQSRKKNEKSIPESSAVQFVFCIWREFQWRPLSYKDSGCKFVYEKTSDEMQLGYVLSEAATILKLARPSDLKNTTGLESVGHI